MELKCFFSSHFVRPRTKTRRCHRELGPPEFSVRRTHFPRELGSPPPPPPPGPKSLDAQNQLNLTHFPRELSPSRTEIPVRIYYTLVHVHQKLARFDSRVKWRVVGKVFVMKPCRRSKSTLQKAATPWGLRMTLDVLFGSVLKTSRLTEIQVQCIT